MSTNHEGGHGFGDPNFSWNEYDQYRPPYPPSVWSLIFSYHESHGAQLTAALDVGCGSGAASTTLAKHFAAVTLADPSVHNLEAAKAKLGSEAFKSSLPHPCEISYKVLPAEDSAVPPTSQDLITIFETIHWTDAPKAVAQAARALKPGGTLALVYYSPRCRILDNPFAEEIWNDILRRFIKDIYRPDDKTPDRTLIRGIETGNIGLDHVPFDAGSWAPGARRIQINRKFKGGADMGFYEGEDTPMAESRVQAGRESLEEIERETDWDMLVGPLWLEEYVKKTYQSSTPLSPDFHEKISGLWHDLYEALENGPRENEKVRITWPVDVVLATRI